MIYLIEILNTITNNKYLNTILIAIITIICSFVLIKIVDLFFRLITKRTKMQDELHIKFIKRIIKGIIIIVGIFYICNQIEFLKTYVLSIVASSSLLVVVLGFAAQEALANIINGTFLTIFKPFNIGDRVKLVNLNIVGIVEDISLRHTIIRTFENVRILIPNSTINKEIVENTNYTDENICNFLDLRISYDSDIDKARNIIRDLVRNHRYFVDYRTEEEKLNKKDDVRVLVRNLSPSAIELRCYIWTKTIGENFEMCSELRRDIVKAFKNNEIEIPCPRVKIEK